MKKQKPIQVPQNQGKKARRQARIVVGSVRPSSPIPPKATKPPKHKRPPGEEID